MSQNTDWDICLKTLLRYVSKHWDICLKTLIEIYVLENRKPKSVAEWKGGGGLVLAF
jgi:hypothetical protein